MLEEEKKTDMKETGANEVFSPVAVVVFWLRWLFVRLHLFTGESSPEGPVETGGVSERPAVKKLLDEMEGSVGDQPRKESSAAASSATRDLDRLMRNLTDLSAQMSSVPNSQTQSTGGADNAIYSRPSRVIRPAGDSKPKLNGSTMADGAAGRASPQAQTSADQLSHLDKMLGHLQSDMSRQGIQAAAKGTCSACQKQIVGQVSLSEVRWRRLALVLQSGSLIRCIAPSVRVEHTPSGIAGLFLQLIR